MATCSRLRRKTRSFRQVVPRTQMSSSTSSSPALLRAFPPCLNPEKSLSLMRMAYNTTQIHSWRSTSEVTVRGNFRARLSFQQQFCSDTAWQCSWYSVLHSYTCRRHRTALIEPRACDCHVNSKMANFGIRLVAAPLMPPLWHCPSKARSA